MVKHSTSRSFPQVNSYKSISIWCRTSCAVIGIWTAVYSLNCLGSGDALADYVGLQDQSFGWKKTAERELAGVTAVRVDCVSQTWHGHRWDHQILIVRPPEVRNADIGLLL